MIYEHLFLRPFHFRYNKFHDYNTLLQVSSIEHFIYGKAIQRQELNDRPVFILGHPRTGTTHLFNLLSLDSKFAYTNTFQAGFPSGFLLLERFKVYLKNVVDNKRPMDNMALTLVCKFSFPKPLMENFF